MKINGLDEFILPVFLQSIIQGDEYLLHISYHGLFIYLFKKIDYRTCLIMSEVIKAVGNTADR